MPVTKEQVRAALYPDEPDYEEASKLGPESLPYIEELVQEMDPAFASKAAYLASLIQHDQSIAILKEAAQSSYPEVRVAAAAGVRNLDAEAGSDVLLSILDDQDAGVRKTALQSVPDDASYEVRSKIQDLSSTDPHTDLRSLSDQVLNRVNT
jgi:HEAT repeat protein